MVATGRVSVATTAGDRHGPLPAGVRDQLQYRPDRRRPDLDEIVPVPGEPDLLVQRQRSVARYATAFALGQQSQGVAAAAGLFPGLGSATVDTDVQHDERLSPTTAQRSAALKPYETLIARGLDAIMVGNAVFPAYDPGRIADLSGPGDARAVAGQLKFRGVAITDAMVRTGLSPVTSGVLAAEAGADIILCNTMERDPPRARVGLQDGRLGRATRLRPTSGSSRSRQRIAG